MNQTIAMAGLDPVALLNTGKSTPGSAAFGHEYNGQTWQFATAENLKEFKGNPEKYSPQFDGQCALAMSLGKTETANPKSWLVQNGKLYVFLNPIARLVWKIIPGRNKNANANWLKLQTG